MLSLPEPPFEVLVTSELCDRPATASADTWALARGGGGMVVGGLWLMALMYRAISRHLRGREVLSPWDHLVSAFEAGVIMVFVSNPLWLIKTRMQVGCGWWCHGSVPLGLARSESVSASMVARWRCVRLSACVVLRSFSR
jgi:hypothetical protein